MAIQREAGGTCRAPQALNPARKHSEDRLYFPVRSSLGPLQSLAAPVGVCARAALLSQLCSCGSAAGQGTVLSLGDARLSQPPSCCTRGERSLRLQCMWPPTARVAGPRGPGALPKRRDFLLSSLVNSTSQQPKCGFLGKVQFSLPCPPVSSPEFLTPLSPAPPHQALDGGPCRQRSSWTSSCWPSSPSLGSHWDPVPSTWLLTTPFRAPAFRVPQLALRVQHTTWAWEEVGPSTRTGL